MSVKWIDVAISVRDGEPKVRQFKELWDEFNGIRRHREGSCQISNSKCPISRWVGSVSPFVAYLTSEAELTGPELEELRRLVNELEDR